MIDVRHLRYFQAVAEELHFRKAAERLNVSQPPLSMQIKQLEQYIGAELFIRSSRHVELTKAGEHFYKRSVQLLKDLEQTVEETALIGEGKSGVVRVGFVSSSAAGVFQKALALFSENSPDVHIDIQQLTNSEVLKAFEGDKLDVAFCRLPLKLPKTLVRQILLEEEYLLAVHESWKRQSLPKLLSHPLVVFPKEKAPEMYEDIMQVFRQHQVDPHILYEASEQLTLLGMVANKLGVAVIPKSASYTKLPGVAYVHLKGFKRRSSLALISRKTKDSATENFVRTVLSSKNIFTQLAS